MKGEFTTGSQLAELLVTTTKVSSVQMNEALKGLVFLFFLWYNFASDLYVIHH